MQWDATVDRAVRDWKGNSLQDLICKLSFGSTVYNLWKLRNDLKFGNDLLSEEKLLQKVCWQVRNWIVSIWTNLKLALPIFLFVQIGVFLPKLGGVCGVCLVPRFWRVNCWGCFCSFVRCDLASGYWILLRFFCLHFVELCSQRVFCIVDGDAPLLPFFL